MEYGADEYGADDSEEEEEGPKLLAPSDVLDMAGYLSIDPVSEIYLLPIARDAVLAELPENWEEKLDAEGDPYYVDHATGSMTSEHPMDQHHRELVENARRTPMSQRDNGTEMDFADTDGLTYFYDFETNTARYAEDEQLQQQYEPSTCVSGHSRAAAPSSSEEESESDENQHDVRVFDTPSPKHSRDKPSRMSDARAQPMVPTPPAGPARGGRKSSGRVPHSTGRTALRIPGSHLHGWFNASPGANNSVEAESRGSDHDSDSTSAGEVEQRSRKKAASKGGKPGHKSKSQAKASPSPSPRARSKSRNKSKFSTLRALPTTRGTDSDLDSSGVSSDEAIMRQIESSELVHHPENMRHAQGARRTKAAIKRSQDSVVQGHFDANEFNHENGTFGRVSQQLSPHTAPAEDPFPTGGGEECADGAVLDVAEGLGLDLYSEKQWLWLAQVCD